MAQSKLMRDAFIDLIFEAACRDRDLMFLSADFGAQALDRFRSDIPDQFIHCGISEQNMIDVAAGLCMSGKKPFVYAMCPFVTLRCFEQTKVMLAGLNLPVTLVGVGAGYAYDDAGPTHYATEDISVMRSLGNIEIISPSDTCSVERVARLCVERPALRYIRLDRKHLPDIYSADDSRPTDDGLAEIESGATLCIISTGYMFQRAREVQKMFIAQGISTGLVDITRVSPINGEVLTRIVSKYTALVTIEEHFLPGGLGSIVSETLSDFGLLRPMLRVGLESKYRYENGGRDHLLSLAGLSAETIRDSVHMFLTNCTL